MIRNRALKWSELLKTRIEIRRSTFYDLAHFFHNFFSLMFSKVVERALTPPSCSSDLKKKKKIEHVRAYKKCLLLRESACTAERTSEIYERQENRAMNANTDGCEKKFEFPHFQYKHHWIQICYPYLAQRWVEAIGYKKILYSIHADLDHVDICTILYFIFVVLFSSHEFLGDKVDDVFLLLNWVLVEKTHRSGSFNGWGNRARAYMRYPERWLTQSVPVLISCTVFSTPYAFLFTCYSYFFTHVSII